MENFCNHSSTLEAWYVICRGRDLKPGKVRRFTLGPGIELAVRRYATGELVASDRFCPHMGADLARSREIDGCRFRCPFHGLVFDGDGTCTSPVPDPEAFRLPTLPVRERYGLVWVYWGETPGYDLPDLGLDRGASLRPPPRSINAHHHMVIANPLDHTHTRVVHDFETHSRTTRSQGIQVSDSVTGVYRKPWMMWVNATHRSSLSIRYWSHGPTVSVADAQWHGRRFVVLFTGRQDADDRCRTQTMIWMDSRNPVHWLRVLSTLFTILKQDVDILNTLRVRTNYLPSDDGMIAFRDMVNSMPVRNAWPDCAGRRAACNVSPHEAATGS